MEFAEHGAVAAVAIAAIGALYGVIRRLLRLLEQLGTQIDALKDKTQDMRLDVKMMDKGQS